MTMRLGFGILSAAIAISAHAECESLIALSKIVSTKTSDKQSLLQQASRFCSEYASNKGVNASAEFGAAYQYLSASFGSSSTSYDQVASKYCSSQDLKQANADAYQEYVELIAPGAYDAYNQCIAQGDELDFSIAPGAITPKEFNLVVSYRPLGGNKKASLIFSTSEGIRCKWPTGLENKITIPIGGTVLHCSRTKVDERGFVSVVRTDAQAKIQIPWQAYGADGLPLDLLAPLNEEINSLRALNVSLQQQLTQSQANAVQDHSQMQSQVASLTTKLNDRAPLRWKHGNNGSVTCHTFCQGAKWGGFSSSTCVASNWLSNPVGYKTCSFDTQQANRDISCLCQEP